MTGLSLSSRWVTASLKARLSMMCTLCTVRGTVYPRGKKWAYAVTLAPDPRDSAAVAAVVTETVQRHGRLDLMVNNAGIGIGGDAEELAVAHWDRVIDVNLRGVVHGVQAAYR